MGLLGVCLGAILALASQGYFRALERDDLGLRLAVEIQANAAIAKRVRRSVKIYEGAVDRPIPLQHQVYDATIQQQGVLGPEILQLPYRGYTKGSDHTVLPMPPAGLICYPSPRTEPPQTLTGR